MRLHDLGDHNDSDPLREINMQGDRENTANDREQVVLQGELAALGFICGSLLTHILREGSAHSLIASLRYLSTRGDLVDSYDPQYMAAFNRGVERAQANMKAGLNWK